MALDTVNGRIKLKRDTTANWNSATGFIPLAGEVIIYTDYQTYDGKTIPGIKIGSGNAYVQDLAFVDEEIRDRLMRHIADTDVHVTSEEKAFWNHKVDIEDAYDITHATLEDETLVFTRT